MRRCDLTEEQRERLRECDREYYVRNRDRIRERDAGPRELTEAQRERKRVYQRKWYAKNRDKVLLRKRARSKAAYQKKKKKLANNPELAIAHNKCVTACARLRKYGITQEEYDSRLRAQCGVCAICKQSEKCKAGNGRTKQLSVDHDHETGDIRGLLCDLCNRALGMMGDDPDRLAAAVEYLKGERC
jgi:hypothetical protein